MLGEGDCVLGAIPKTGPLRYFAVLEPAGVSAEMDLTMAVRYFAVLEPAGVSAEMDLLKTGVLASLYRLEGALDAAGDC